MNWITAFTITQIIEITIGCFIWKDEKISLYKRILTIFGASLITHPMVWFVFSDIRRDGNFSYAEYLLMAETYAYSVEALYYYVFKVKRPILLSCAANTGSFLTGLIIFEYIL